MTTLLRARASEHVYTIAHIYKWWRVQLLPRKKSRIVQVEPEGKNERMARNDATQVM